MIDQKPVQAYSATEYLVYSFFFFFPSLDFYIELLHTHTVAIVWDVHTKNESPRRHRPHRIVLWCNVPWGCLWFIPRRTSQSTTLKTRDFVVG